MPAPRFLGYQALLGEPKPINWQGIGQALWESNLNSPIRGAYNLMNTPYDVLAGGPSPEMDQAVADSFDAAGGVTVGSMPIPKPSNSLTMGIKTSLEGVRAKYPNVKLDVHETPQGITLSRIEVPKGERGKGIGTSVMADLTAIADETGLPFALSPSGDFGGSVGRLKDFYSRFGFVPNKGRNKDFRISESYVRNPSQPPAPKGIKAYHGSPHSFDKFSMDKIGTGEGAQAYGHGLYFAENEDIARGYRDALKPGNGIGPEDTASRVLDGHGGDRDAAIASLTDTIDRAFANNTPYEEVQRLMQAKTILNTAPEKASGSMYEVNIDADPNAFLDWDKPLSEQPEAVQKAYNKTLKGSLVTREIGNNENFGPLTDVSVPGGGSLGVFTKDQLPDVLENPAKYAPLTGGGLYSSLVENHHLNVNPPTPFLQSKAKATEKLKAQGIPGIKYLDAGSRGAGDGTRNYVVFDDKLISIVKKYGIAGASAMLGYNLLEGVDKSQAAELQQADTHHQYTNWLNSGGI